MLAWVGVCACMHEWVAMHACVSGCACMHAWGVGVNAWVPLGG